MQAAQTEETSMKVTSLVALAALIGAVQPMSAEAKDKVFALVPKAMNNPFFDQARDGCMKAAKEIGGIQRARDRQGAGASEGSQHSGRDLGQRSAARR
jgi:ABC-type sugar transport system substrate-binding protein